MTNWLRRKLHNFLYPEERLASDKRTMNSIAISGRGNHHSQSLGSDSDPLRFTVYNASGGKIVEISHYDQKQDRHHTSLHIITSDEDFGTELGKIAFIESIKKG